MVNKDMAGGVYDPSKRHLSLQPGMNLVRTHIDPDLDDQSITII